MKYFISYKYEYRQNLFEGHREVERDSPIASIEDIKAIEEAIRDKIATDELTADILLAVTVTGWQRFESPSNDLVQIGPDGMVYEWPIESEGHYSIELLRELMDNSDVYYSAIELHHGFDADDWKARVTEVLNS